MPCSSASVGRYHFLRLSQPPRLQDDEAGSARSARTLPRKRAGYSSIIVLFTEKCHGIVPARGKCEVRKEALSEQMAALSELELGLIPWLNVENLPWSRVLLLLLHEAESHNKPLRRKVKEFKGGYLPE